MASKAHAFFCFEVLAAAFENTEHPDLQEILDIYDQSVAPEEQDGVTHARGDAAQSLPQLPSISRLQAGDATSRSMSSTSSSTSLSSSASQLTDATGKSIASPITYASRLTTTESYPMFVTWNVLSRSGSKSLRGCIGTFEALPLEKGLEQYSLTSAFEDTRFSPIPASQLSSLSCSLTLLADFEQCRDALDWSLGMHGIRISFTHQNRRHGATYLPEVAVEQGWSQEEALESLMRKAGWNPSARRMLRASSQPWQDVKDFKVIRYTGLKASASYKEWQDWRKNTQYGTAR